MGYGKGRLGNGNLCLELCCMEAISLWSCFEGIPDPRRKQGRRYSLSSMLGIVIAAILSGRTTLCAITRWAKKLTLEQLVELGIYRGRAPGQTTLHDLFDKLPVQEVEKALGLWVCSLLGDKAPGHIAIDGKVLRGSVGAEYPALHLLAAFCVDINSVLLEAAVEDKTNEITAAKALLGRIPVKGAIVTGDAIFCQKELCRRIAEDGGDFIFTVKNNQESLKDDVAATFAAAFSPDRDVAINRTRQDGGKTTRTHRRTYH
jgi:predicted transposase YbfD/YdcC